MSGARDEYLVVRAGARRVALPLASLVEVIETAACLTVPAREPALRGVMRVRGRLVPLVHLGAFLDGRPCPEAVGEAAVVVAVGERRLCLEVEEAAEVVRVEALPLAVDASLPWASGVARLPEGMVPLLDVPAVGARLMETGTVDEHR